MILSTLLSAVSFFAASEFEAACTAYVEESGSSIDCTCLAEKVAETPSIGEELMAAEPGDASALSEEALAAVADCGGDV